MAKNKSRRSVLVAPVPEGASSKPPFLPPLSSTMVTVGIDMFATILVGTALGWCGDMYWEVKPWGIIIGFLFGAISGLTTTYRKLCKIGAGFSAKKQVRSKY